MAILLQPDVTGGATYMDSGSAYGARFKVSAPVMLIALTPKLYDVGLNPTANFKIYQVESQTLLATSNNSSVVSGYTNIPLKEPLMLEPDVEYMFVSTKTNGNMHLTYSPGDVNVTQGGVTLTVFPNITISSENNYPLLDFFYEYTMSFGLVVETLSSVNLRVNINGAAKEIDKGWVNINGELKEIDKMWTNINGELKEI